MTNGTNEGELYERERSCNNALSIGEFARAGVEVIERRDEELLIVRHGMAPPTVIDLEQYQATPRRARGTNRVTRELSFVEAVLRWQESGSVIFANEHDFALTAVLNDHLATGGDAEHLAAWRDRLVSYIIPRGESWVAWTGISGRWLPQATMLDFLEDNVENVLEPGEGELLSILSDLRGVRSTNFTNAVRLSDGTVKIEWAESQSTSGGRGSVGVPEKIKLALEPVRGSELFAVHARLQHRVEEGGLSIRVVLQNLDDVLRRAFEDVVERVGDGVNAEGVEAERGYAIPVLFGTP